MLSGTVVNDLTGSPLVGVRVAIESTPFTTSTDDAGRFEFPELPPGEYEVRVDVDERSWRTLVEVKAFATTHVDVRVELSVSAAAADTARANRG